MAIGVIGGKVLVKDTKVCLDCCEAISCWAVFHRCACQNFGQKVEYVHCDDLPPGFVIGDVAEFVSPGDTEGPCYQYVATTDRPPAAILKTIGVTYNRCDACCCWYEWDPCTCGGSWTGGKVYVPCQLFAPKPAVSEVRLIDGHCYTYNGVTTSSLPGNTTTDTGTIVTDCDHADCPCPCSDCGTCDDESPPLCDTCDGSEPGDPSRMRLVGASIGGPDDTPYFCDCPTFEFTTSNNGWTGAGGCCGTLTGVFNTYCCHGNPCGEGGVFDASVSCAGANPQYSQLEPGEWYVDVTFIKEHEFEGNYYSNYIYRKPADQRTDCCKFGTYAAAFAVTTGIEDNMAPPCSLSPGSVTIEYGQPADGDP